ncbi:hypothetical protein C8R43DRAFT_962542 [Mycena crocata]|nr:hypothetical protein C8R43DRAFT_962542 [Mycena crocata]
MIQDVKFLFNAQHNCRTAGCSATGRWPRMQERVESDLTEIFIVHQPLDRFIINTHTFHNAHLLHEALPRDLTVPIPVFTDRRAKHDELAVTLQETKDGKRKRMKEKADAKRKEREEKTGGTNKGKRPKKGKGKKRDNQAKDSDGEGKFSGSDRPDRPAEQPPMRRKKPAQKHTQRMIQRVNHKEREGEKAVEEVALNLKDLTQTQTMQEGQQQSKQRPLECAFKMYKVAVLVQFQSALSWLYIISQPSSRREQFAPGGYLNEDTSDTQVFGFSASQSRRSVSPPSSPERENEIHVPSSPLRGYTQGDPAAPGYDDFVSRYRYPVEWPARDTTTIPVAILPIITITSPPSPKAEAVISPSPFLPSRNLTAPNTDESGTTPTATVIPLGSAGARQIFQERFAKLLAGESYANGEDATSSPMLKRFGGWVLREEIQDTKSIQSTTAEQKQFTDQFLDACSQYAVAANPNALQQECLGLFVELAEHMPVLIQTIMDPDHADAMAVTVRSMEHIMWALRILADVQKQAKLELARQNVTEENWHQRYSPESPTVGGHHDGNTCHQPWLQSLHSLNAGFFKMWPPGVRNLVYT